MSDQHADTVRMDEKAVEAVIDLLWQEFDRYLPDGAVHPHAMRAIAYRIVELLQGEQFDGTGCGPTP